MRPDPDPEATRKLNAFFDWAEQGSVGPPSGCKHYRNGKREAKSRRNRSRRRKTLSKRMRR